MRTLLRGTMISVLALLPAAAHAARLVILPVAVGSSPEPAGDLLSALAAGLQQAGPWQVVHGAALKTLQEAPLGLTDEEHAKAQARLDEAADKIGSAAAEAVTALEALRDELAGVVKTRVAADRDLDLWYRASGALVAALAGAGNDERAKVVAQETLLLFPGRKPGEADRVPPQGAERLAQETAPSGARLSVKTRPEGCRVRINGQMLGPAPVEIAALPGGVYQAQAICPAADGAAELRSFPKRIVVGEAETARQDVLDAEFERMFRAEGARRLRFASSAERRQLEDSYARRLAERFDADVVVLASVGELSGADWMNARLYLRSGYLNRQGLVRLESVRATALGRYLATGKEIPGVLRPEEAGALVAASQGGAPRSSKADPWYTDVVGWSFTGVGAAGFTLGLFANAAANRTAREADAVRGDSERQQRLHRDAQRSKFLANIGLVGGGLMGLTGIVLLAIPEYTDTQGELFVISPTVGGATFELRGRF